MQEITLSGKTYRSTEDLKTWLRLCRETLFEYLPLGTMPANAIHSKAKELSILINGMLESPSLNNAERSILEGMVELEKHFRCFDESRGTYEALEREQRMLHTLRYGKSCAGIFEKMIEGSMEQYDFRNRMFWYQPNYIGKDGKRAYMNIEENPLWKSKK